MNGDFRVGRWLVVPSLNGISRKGTTVRLEPKAMEVLVCLAQHAGETLPKETLFHTVWPDTFVTDGVLTRSISPSRNSATLSKTTPANPALSRPSRNVAIGWSLQ